MNANIVLVIMYPQYTKYSILTSLSSFRVDHLRDETKYESHTASGTVSTDILMCFRLRGHTPIRWSSVILILPAAAATSVPTQPGWPLVVSSSTLYIQHGMYLFWGRLRHRCLRCLTGSMADRHRWLGSHDNGAAAVDWNDTGQYQASRVDKRSRGVAARGRHCGKPAVIVVVVLPVRPQCIPDQLHIQWRHEILFGVEQHLRQRRVLFEGHQWVNYTILPVYI